MWSWPPCNSASNRARSFSVLWQTVPYVILTAAEVLVSTTGLEFAFREAAPEMKSIIMSFWLLTIAFGDLFVAVLTKLLSNGTSDSSVSSGGFLQYAGMTFVVAVLFTIVATFYKYRDPRRAGEMTNGMWGRPPVCRFWLALQAS